MTIRYALATGLAAAALGLVSFGVAAPAMAASPVENCMAALPSQSLVDQSTEDADAIAAAENACASAVATPSVRSHGAEIVLTKPLPARLQQELKPYMAS